MTTTCTVDAAGQLDDDAVRRAVQPEVEAVERRARPSGARTSRLLPYSGRPAQPRIARVAPLPRRADQPVLLHHVDDFLEPEQVGLEGRHVGEDQRQPLRPAIGEVEDVERRDVQAVHGSALGSSAIRRAPADPRPAARRRTSSPPLLGLDPDPPAVLLDDVAGDRQPEAGPAAGLGAQARTVDLVEALEDPSAGGARDADPVILDRRHDLPVHGRDADC